MKRVIRQSECDTFQEVAKLFQQVFDILSENEEYNALVDEHNEGLLEGDNDA